MQEQPCNTVLHRWTVKFDSESPSAQCSALVPRKLFLRRVWIENQTVHDRPLERRWSATFFLTNQGGCLNNQKKVPLDLPCQLVTKLGHASRDSPKATPGAHLKSRIQEKESCNMAVWCVADSRYQLGAAEIKSLLKMFNNNFKKNVKRAPKYLQFGFFSSGGAFATLLLAGNTLGKAKQKQKKKAMLFPG